MMFYSVHSIMLICNEHNAEKSEKSPA